jgi:Tfp pilus assembly protein PilV
MAENKLKSRVKGSSILEVVIAMVVIVAIFGIALMIFSNVMRSSLTVKKIRAQAIAQQLLLTTEAQRSFTDTAFLSGDLQIERRSGSYTQNTDLAEIRVTALDSNKDTLVSAAKIIIRP